MFARIATTESQPERLDEMMRRLQEQTMPVLKDQKGFRGAFGMIDRTNGTAVAISLWETQEDEQASVAAVAQARAQALQQAGVTETTTIEVFEVAVQV